MSEFSLKFRGVRGSYPIANKDFLKFGNIWGIHIYDSKTALNIPIISKKNIIIIKNWI